MPQGEPMATTIDERCTLVRAFTEFELLPDLLARTPEAPAPWAPGAPGEETLGFGLPETLNEAAALESWTDYLDEFGANMDHAEPEDLPPDVVEERYVAEDAWRLANRLRWVTPTGLSAAGQRLAYIAERPLMRRTRSDNLNLIDTVSRSVREWYVGGDGLEVVLLLQEGARMLAKPNMSGRAISRGSCWSSRGADPLGLRAAVVCCISPRRLGDVPGRRNAPIRRAVARR